MFQSRSPGIQLPSSYTLLPDEVFGIALDPEHKDDIAAFAKEFNVNYPLLYSDGKIESESGGILGVPTSYLINHRDETVKKHSGIINKEAFAKAIQSLL
jgi:hypothetical protein